MKNISFFIAAVLVYFQLQAQNITNYSFTASSGTFTQLTGGTTMNLSGGTADEGYFNDIPVGFTFYYMGAAFTAVSVSTNGWMTFGQNIAGAVSSNSLAGNGARPLVAPLWDNLDLQVNTNFSYRTTGTAPNQVFTAEWLNVQWYYLATGNTISFQVKLYEADKRIEFIYRPESGTVAGASASIGITATATGSGNYLSLNNSSSSPTVSSTSETTSINTKPADGQVYTFSPICTTPADPVSMSFTSVTQTGMTVNWSDNSTTETYFLLYSSQDGINYSQAGNIASTTTSETGGAYSCILAGLLPGVTYYFRVTANNEGSPASGFLSGSNTTSSPGNVTSIAGGNWTDGTTWSSGSAPTSLDNATIADGHTVIINGTANCNALYVGQGASGILRFGTTATSLTTVQGITVAAGGIFDAGAASGANLAHTLNIGGSSATATGSGSLTVNGTFDMYIGSSNGKCTINFYGIPNASVSGSGTIDFYRVVLNKGNVTPTETVTPPVLEILASYTGSGSATTGFLYTHTAGTLKIGGSYTFSNPVYTTASYSIGALGAIWLNNSTFTISGMNGSPTNNGLVKLSAGTYNIGNASGNSMGAGNGAVFLIEGGTMNITGRLNTNNTVTYKQSGGTVNVTSVGNASSGNPGFGITDAGSVFTMSGGTICVVLANTSAGTRIDYNVSASTTNITGGTLQLGNSSSGTAKTFIIKGITPNLTLTNTSANHSCSLSGDLTIKGDLALNGTGTFSNNSNNLALAGMNATNPGNIIINTGSNLALNTSSAKSLTFSSSFGGQSITNNGTITGSQLPGLTINNTYGGGGTVTIPGGLTILGDVTLNLAKGTLNIGSGELTIGTGGATGFNYIRGDGTTSGTITFNYGTGAINYTYNGSSAQVTGTELPSSISGELAINNSSGVSLNSALQAGKLNLVAGTLHTTSSNLLTIAGTAATDLTYTSGQVNGPLSRTFPASLVSGSTYLFPLGKSIYRPLEMVNPVTNSGGTVVIRSEVFDESSGGTTGSSMYSLNTNRYWTAEITSGAGNFTSTSIRLTETGLTSNHGIAKSSSLNGTYELASVTGPSGNTLITDVMTSLSYFVIGEKRMNYVSSTCTQANTNYIRQASSDQEIIGIQVVTAGNIDPATITSFTFSTNGTSDAADIAAAKVFYTGTSSVFSGSSQFGTTLSNPSGSFNITGSQALAEGTNYFWLAYNIAADAGNGNAIDGECTSFTIRGSAKAPAVQAPAGQRLVIAALSGTVTVGASGTYPTLTSAGGLFEAINLGGLSGNLTARVISSITETGANGLSQVYEVGAGHYTLTIQPDEATERTISGNPGGGLIRLAGADRVIIDGSYDGSGKYLNIINTATSGTIAAIQVISSGTGQGSKYNTIKNCKVSTGHNATGSYAISAGGSTAGTAGDDNDSLTIMNCNISKSYYGIYIGANSTGMDNDLVLSGDSVGSSVTENTVVKYGIFIEQCSGALIEGNTVFNIKGTTKPYGMHIGTGCVNSLVSGNRICGIIYTGTGTSGGTGMFINTGSGSSNLTVANNLLYDISGTGSNILGTGSITGIHVADYNGGIDFYYNSVNLSGTISNSLSNDLSMAFCSASSLTSCLNLQNNIFRNSIEDITSNAFAYAIYFSWNDNTIGTIDYNDYDAEGPEAMLGHIMTSNISTLANWRTRTGDDAYSIAIDPVYASNTDLRLDLSSPARKAGVPVTGILTDFDGTDRSETTPNMGAYETATDVKGPFFSYTPLIKTASLSARTLSVNLTDSTGVPTSGSGMPVLYWKINSDSWNSATGVHISGSQYDFSFGAGVVLNDVVSYYIAAQDICNPPKVSVSPSAGADGFSADPPACATPPDTPNSYTIVEGLNDTITVGTGGACTNLTGNSGLFKMISNNILTGNLTAEIISDLTEEGTNQLAEWLEEGTGNYTLTIKPSSTTERLISGNPTGGDLIRFNGADRVIVDGRYGGDGKYLRFRNTGDLYALFELYNGACHDTIRNCYIEGGSSNSTSGTIRLAFSTASTGNSYNAILHNVIRDRTDAADVPYNAIYSNGTNGKENSFNTISENEILNFTNYGINVTGTGNGRNWSITGNSIYNNLSTPPSTFQRGIYFFPGSNSVSNLISGNYIGGQEPLCGGPAWVNSGNNASFYGIYANVGILVASDISDNTIQNISLTNTQAGNLYGIYFYDGLANITGNTIGHSEISRSLGSATTSASIEGIRIFSESWNINVEHNTVNNLVLTGESGSPEAIGIFMLTADLKKNSITGIGYCINSGISPYIYGIYNWGMPGYDNEISNNVIALDGGASADPEIYGYLEYSFSENSYSMIYNSISISGPPAATASTYAFYRYVDATYELKNNIFANFRESGGMGTNYAVYLDYYDALKLDADHNDLYCPEGITVFNDTIDLPTLSDWQSASGQDIHSISGDPLFQDNSNDLHPDDASPVVGAGTYAEWVETDIEDNPRDEVSPTIGAYEIAPPAAKTWNGSISSDWHDAGNWTPSGVPVAADNLLIPSGTAYNCTLSTTGLVCRNLTVNAGAIVTVNSTATLNVNGIMTIKDGASMTNYGNIILIGP